MTFRSLSAAFVVPLAIVLLASLTEDRPRAATTPGPYTVTDLGTLGTGQSAQAYDVNEATQVTGYAGNHAFLWDDGILTDLGSLGVGSIGQAINEAGQVAGYSSLTGSGNRATLWDSGTKINLTPGLASSDTSGASGINDLRQVVGTINSATPFVWQNGTITTLGHLGGGAGNAFDINNAGQVVGSSKTTLQSQVLGPLSHAALWQGGIVIDLGVLPGDEESGAAAINETGQIVGSSDRVDPETYEVTSHSFLYDDGVMTALPVASTESYGGDINDAGVVVGTMRAGGGVSPYRAYIYADGVVTDLNTLIASGSGLHLAYALGVNNAGQIVGVAYDATARYHAYLLTPVAPGTSLVTVSDVSVTEGDTGTRAASFIVRLSVAASQPVSASYATANGTASAGSDYTSASGTVTFSPGQTTATIAVLVSGDRTAEPSETFVLNLTGVTGTAQIADSQGVGTIIDDEKKPRK
jgi:probable HAF family extracellular repeat protein